jgi:Tfp pilus assembly protein PilE
VEDTVKRNYSSELGMSLVEATIILMVLAVLTAVVAPSIGDYVEDARQTKAKEDVEAIGTGILRLLRDTGLPCLSTSPGSSPCSLANRVDLLVSSGNEPAVTAAAFDPGADALINTAADQTAGSATVNWAGASGVAGAGATNVPIAAGDRATVDAQLVSNTAGYTAVSFTTAGGPQAGLGWRGAYVTGPVGADPWGFVYQANTVFLSTATDATDGTGVGEMRGGWPYDVIVISAGSNGSVQTKFGDSTNGGSVAVGDDVIYTVQGATR